MPPRVYGNLAIIKTPSIQICHDKQEDHTYKSQRDVCNIWKLYSSKLWVYIYWGELDITIENIYMEITSLLKLSTWETI